MALSPLALCQVSESLDLDPSSLAKVLFGTVSQALPQHEFSDVELGVSSPGKTCRIYYTRKVFLWCGFYSVR